MVFFCYDDECMRGEKIYICVGMSVGDERIYLWESFLLCGGMLGVKVCYWLGMCGSV